jgi:hypothetical protein
VFQMHHPAAFRPPCTAWSQHQTCTVTSPMLTVHDDGTGTRRVYTADSTGPIRTWEALAGKSSVFVHRERDQVVTALCCVSNTDLWVGSASGVRALAAPNPTSQRTTAFPRSAATVRHADTYAAVD